MPTLPLRSEKPFSLESPESPTRHGHAARRSKRLLALLAILLGALLLGGCFVLSLVGPSTVATGQVARYTLELETNAGNVSDVTVFLIIDLPAGWSLEGSAYAGMANGKSYEGMGMLDLPPGICNLPPLGPERQRITLSAGPFPLVQLGDGGIAEVDFRVDGPEGEHRLDFWTGGVADEGSDCDTKPTSFTVTQIDALFVDDFETGDLSQWDFSVP